MSKPQHLMQTVRRALAGTRAGAMVRRLGIARWALARYERRALEIGVHHITMGGNRLAFRVHDRQEVSRVDGFRRNERAFMNRLLGSIQDGDTILDVGANIGMVAVFLASAARHLAVRVHAFEANPETAVRAQQNADLNRCDNIVVHPLALTDHRGFVNLYTNAEQHGADSLIPTANADTSCVEVPGERADAIVRALGLEPTVMKIDVEGAEFEVLRGCQDTLVAGTIRELFIEIHPQLLAGSGRSEASIVSFLAEHGYASSWRCVRGGEAHHHFRRARARP